MFFKWAHKSVLMEEMTFSKCNRAILPALLIFSSALASSLKPFHSNLCTGFPPGTKTNPNQWRHCCIEHDLDFWAGGCKHHRISADKRLRSCVEQTGAREIAFLMYLGVRIGSYSPFKIKEERWGNGWLDGRPDGQALTRIDLESIRSELNSNPPEQLDPESILRFTAKLEAQIKETPACPSE